MTRGTAVDLAVRVVLKWALYCGVLVGAVVLDSHYDSVMPANVCRDTYGRGGTWDCHLARRVVVPMDALGRVGSALGQLR